MSTVEARQSLGNAIGADACTRHARGIARTRKVDVATHAFRSTLAARPTRRLAAAPSLRLAAPAGTVAEEAVIGPALADTGRPGAHAAGAIAVAETDFVGLAAARAHA